MPSYYFLLLLPFKQPHSVKRDNVEKKKSQHKPQRTKAITAHLQMHRWYYLCQNRELLNIPATLTNAEAAVARSAHRWPRTPRCALWQTATPPGTSRFRIWGANARHSERNQVQAFGKHQASSMYVERADLCLQLRCAGQSTHVRLSRSALQLSNST